MKLNTIREAGHWEVANIDYPNSLAKPKKNQKRPLSFYLHPEDRDNFFKGIPMGKQIEEELDATSVMKDLEDKISTTTQDPQQKEKTDSINNRHELERQKQLKTRVLDPQIKKLQTNISGIQKKIQDQDKELKKNANDSQDLYKNMDTMTKDIENISKYL